MTTIQRILTIGLHLITPMAMIAGPRAKGAALWATRVSLSGSAGTLAGAAVQLAGSPIGAYVSAAGTAALIGGAATRGLLALHTARKAAPLWNKIKSNVRNILGFPKKEKVPVQIPETKTPKLPAPSPSTTIPMPDGPNRIAKSIREPSRSHV